MSIRRLRASESAGWRDIRLRALREAPAAFGSRYEDQVQWPESRWRERTVELATSSGQVMFVAEAEAGELVGCAGAFIESDDPPQVISMWVDPIHRGTGVGRLLLDAVVAWARQRGADRLSLRVVSDNLAARSLYLGYGFMPTGVSQLNEHGRREEELALAL